ncbi:hypothetical protein HRH25_23670, partial [Flavisolibacter sp. BT320]|nr:hypothetical protein [Flavisolibacter longurius]
ISSKKLGETAEGHLLNQHQFQGTYSEMDEDIGWNDFTLRNYDPQVGRFVQQDPYQQYPSPYTGMGNDPVNLIDPSGGVSIPPGVGQALSFAKEGGTLAEVIITFTRVTNSVSAPLRAISIVSTTLSLLNSTVQGCMLINGNMATGAVGGNTGLDDFILVDTKSKTVQVTKTDEAYDVVQIDDGKRYLDYRKGVTEEKYRELGYKVRPGPEGVGMGAVDGTIAMLPTAKFFKWIGGRIASWLGSRGASSIFSHFTAKIAKQMVKRGWTKDLIHKTVNNPYTKRAATNKETGNAATAYFTKDGSYVVRDNITGQIIQVSDRLDPKWIPDPTIIKPYIPK